ncbi:MAG: hypothetical protein H7Y12_09325 [Sphingobacteriaceae bacterium]|nr:hypothetical protein [Cytophagaceae bacterium]
MKKPFRKNVPLLLLVGLFISAASPKPADEVTGTLTYQSAGKTYTLAIRHVSFVKGPDAVEPTKRIRRLIFSNTDFSATLKASPTLAKADGKLTEALEVDLDAGSRLNYWLVLNDQRVQYSGTEKLAALTLRTDTPTRLAGTLRFDGTPAGGPQVDVTFEASLLKEFK